MHLPKNGGVDGDRLPLPIDVVRIASRFAFVFFSIKNKKAAQLSLAAFLFLMVDQPEPTTHGAFLSEIIEFQPGNRTIDTSKIASLYQEKKLSTPQIARQMGCSKTFVITTLQRMQLLRTKSASQTDPDNYRSPVAPFGYHVVDGKLLTYPSELKVCRLIVDLIDRQGMNYLSAGQYLNTKGIRNRRGEATWHNYTVSRIYERWKGKL